MFNTAWDLSALMVPTKAAAVYAAQENSLFMNGFIIPNIVVPAGSFSAQVPVFAKTSAEVLTQSLHNVNDIESVKVLATSNTITLDLFAARDTLRDLGGVNPTELGRVLGNAVAQKYDEAVVVELLTATTTQVTDATINPLWDAAATIRQAGEMGPLMAIVSPAYAALLMKAIGGAAFAGGDYQTEALRNGFVTKVAGISVFQSAHMTALGVVFGADAMRTASQGGLDMEMQRRAEAVGTDIVASYAGAAGLIDQSRIVELV
tara:strand:+ start:263 stop:1048 length:786 start_codon:yes stop_codon:yes gene_type:complete